MRKRLRYATLLTGILLTGCGKQKPDGNAVQKAPLPPASAGLEVKDRFRPGMIFPHVAVVDQAGNRYDLFNLLSKPHNIVLLIDAFCPACGEESQKIQKFLLNNPNLNLVGVSKDSFPAIFDFKKRYGIIFPILRDDEEKMVPDYRRAAFPTLILVGKERVIVQLYETEIPQDQAAPLLRMLLGE